jgi:hypothetical protein
MSRPPRRPRLALLAVPLLVWACGSTTPPSASPSAPPSVAPSSAAPTPVGSQDLAAVYAQINSQVQAIRGLEELKPVVPKIVSQEELATVLRTLLDKDYPPAKIAADEALYKGLGLLPPDAKLADVFIELLESQVAGLYDPTTDSLYVLSKEGGVGPIERFFYSHEYDHALQDQHFDLDAFQKGLEDQSDRLMARQALVEGDAYVTMTYWLQANLTPQEIGEVTAAASDPEALAALQRIPPIVQNQITFSAIQGTFFAIAQQQQSGWAGIDQSFSDPPESSEQILHADKWAAREAPVVVDLPGDLAGKMGKGWTVSLEDTWGEQQMQIWIGGTGQATAAQGWGGDRITMLQGPDGAWAIAWHTVWDSPTDAEEFETAADAVLGNVTGKGSLLPGEGGTTRWVAIGSDATVLGKIAGALGLAG